MMTNIWIIHKEDSYLCGYCNREFDSYDEATNHSKWCNSHWITKKLAKIFSDYQE